MSFAAHTHSQSPVVAVEVLQQLLPKPGEIIRLIPIGRLLPNPNNPRGPVIPETCEDLAASIRAVNGIVQPLVVTPFRGAYHIVAGHRRHCAGRLAGLTELPCIIRELTLEQQLDIMLIENIQRKQLNPMQEARGFDMMRRMGATKHDIMRRIGCPSSFLDSRLTLLTLSPKVQKMFELDKIAPSNAQALAALENPKEQEKFALMAASRLLTGKQLEGAIKRHLGREPKRDRGRAKKRMVKGDEYFTRTEALSALERMGSVSYGALHSAFNDVCEDICVEGDNRELCHACPVPRFIMSVLRRADADDE